MARPVFRNGSGARPVLPDAVPPDELEASRPPEAAVAAVVAVCRDEPLLAARPETVGADQKALVPDAARPAVVWPRALRDGMDPAAETAAAEWMNRLAPYA